MNSSVMYLVVFLSGLSLVICVVSFFYFRSYLKRRTSQKQILADLQDEVNRIVRAIDETTERDISLLEERERSLKSLLEEVDKRLKIYVRELETRKAAEDAYAALQQKKPVVSGQSQEAYYELGKNRYRGNTAPPAESPPPARSREDKTKVSPEPDPAFPLPNFSVNSGTNDSPSMGDRIRELVKAGFTAPVIASRLGLSIAEVEFAAALLERREG